MTASRSSAIDAPRGEFPLVSIVMATYNCADTLEEALESIERQTYANWELVVCDDASTDGTVAALEDFAERRPERVVILRNTVNQKLAAALNRCLVEASGDLVARMDADDRCTPDRLEQQVAFLRGNPDVHLVGTSIQRFDEDGPTDVVTPDARPDRWSMRGDVPFVHGTVVLRKYVYDALGGYTVSPRTVRGQDKDLWFRFFSQGYVGANLPQPLYWVREDLRALKRRTFRSRFNSYRTTLIGFRLLGYPRHWYVAPTAALLKGMVPVAAIARYRRLQGGAYARKTAAGPTG